MQFFTKGILMDKLARAREEINRIDSDMARLFCKRMEAAKDIADYKAENSLPIFDAARESAVIERNSSLVGDELKQYYTEFLAASIRLSRSYQVQLHPSLSNNFREENGTRIISVDLKNTQYNIWLGYDIMSEAGKYFDLGRRVLILTDDGVPPKYSEEIAKQCKHPFIFTVPHGEHSKSLSSLEKILSFMAKNEFTRTDCVVAVGGGVVGDLAGLAASVYMRGVDFYNIPTTLLSQVDSSIGGKTAVDLDGFKNTVGTFYQPRGVLIDTKSLLTLDTRNIRAGLAESLKMACTSDPELFALFESGEYLSDIENVILRSLLIKKGVVERDERESGERKILNFGHTVGHAIESATDLIHGESVAVGMLCMCDANVRERLERILCDMGLPTSVDADKERLYDLILRDKKASGDNITVVYVREIGKAELITLPKQEIYDHINCNGGTR